jgi:hypothetical protein
LGGITPGDWQGTTFGCIEDDGVLGNHQTEISLQISSNWLVWAFFSNDVI